MSDFVWDEADDDGEKITAFCVDDADCPQSVTIRSYDIDPYAFTIFFPGCRFPKTGWATPSIYPRPGG